jgi:hypothetical protein
VAVNGGSELGKKVVQYLKKGFGAGVVGAALAARKGETGGNNGGNGNKKVKEESESDAMESE